MRMSRKQKKKNNFVPIKYLRSSHHDQVIELHGHQHDAVTKIQGKRRKERKRKQNGRQGLAPANQGEICDLIFIFSSFSLFFLSPTLFFSNSLSLSSSSFFFFFFFFLLELVTGKVLGGAVADVDDLQRLLARLCHLKLAPFDFAANHRGIKHLAAGATGHQACAVQLPPKNEQLNVNLFRSTDFFSVCFHTHPIEQTDPTSGFWRSNDHPAWSQRRNVLYDPTANIEPSTNKK